MVTVHGTDNLADILTKNVEHEGINKHLNRTNCEIGTGRHELMPKVARAMVGDRDVEGDDGLAEDVEMECGLFRLDHEYVEFGNACDQNNEASGATRVNGGLASPVSTTGRSWDLG